MTLLEDEVVLCMQYVSLEISENTHERKPFLAVGTAIVHGEDLAASGAVYLYTVIDVAPEPGRPETGRRLKQVTREPVKGAVTALCEVTAYGFLLIAQGQKCMVRGLKENGSLLPVAFMDMQCYVSVLKNLEGTGMALMGDAIKGIWFSGFGVSICYDSPLLTAPARILTLLALQDEPYKLTLFGKSQGRLAVADADFMPHEKQLFFVVADDERNLTVFEYNPDSKIYSKET